MSTIPTFLVGRNASLYSFTPQTPAASTGVLTAGTVGSLLGVFDSFEYQGNVQEVEISSADATMTNYVTTKDDFTVTAVEIAKADGTSKLFTGWMAYDFFVFAVQATAPGTSPAAGLTLTVTCKRSSISKTLVEGKNTVTFTGKPCGITVTYA